MTAACSASPRLAPVAPPGSNHNKVQRVVQALTIVAAVEVGIVRSFNAAELLYCSACRAAACSSRCTEQGARLPSGRTGRAKRTKQASTASTTTAGQSHMFPDTLERSQLLCTPLELEPVVGSTARLVLGGQ